MAAHGERSERQVQPRIGRYRRPIVLLEEGSLDSSAAGDERDQPQQRSSNRANASQIGVRQREDHRNVLCGADNDDLALATGLRNRLAVLPKRLDVQLDRLSDKVQGLLTRIAHGDTPRQVRDMGSPCRLATLEDDGVLQDLLLPETSLLPDRVQSTARHILAQLAGNRDRPRFGRMPELSVTALRTVEHPPISLDQLHDLADLH